MNSITFDEKTYQVDQEEFLLDPDQWDETFAQGMAERLGMKVLLERHWRILRFIRSIYKEMLRRPTASEICNSFDMTFQTLLKLFPTGYRRGACKLAGMTASKGAGSLVKTNKVEPVSPDEPLHEQTYRVDVDGYLVDPAEWDGGFAMHKARELGMAGVLTKQHWQIIRFLRDRFLSEDEIPTIYETCDDAGIDLEDFKSLFPDGYHRGAVKIAGLRANSINTHTPRREGKDERTTVFFHSEC
jgi:tRNA 2-thiouridine synthesizing protein E